MRLISTISWSALATLLRLANGFIAMKIIAVLVGPLGVAIIGQFNNFITIVMTLALGGISSGVIKYTAQLKNDQEELYKVWHTITWVSGILTAVIALGMIIYHNWLAQRFLGSIKYGNILVIFSFSLIFYVVNNLLLGILNGLGNIKRFNILNTLNSCVSVLLTLVLVYKYTVYGALLALVTSQSISLLIIIFFVYNQFWFKVNNFFGKFEKKYFKKLMSYTAMSLTSVCVVPTSQMFVRGYLASNTSWETAGCWQGLQRISDSYLMIVYAALGTYFLPKLACLNDKKQIRLEIVNGYKYILPFVFISLIGIFLARDFIIHLLFAKSFYQMRSMFFFQLVGDFFKVSSYFIAYLLLAKSKVKLYIVIELVFGVSFTLLSYLFINSFGGQGVVAAFALNYFFFFLMFIFLFKKGYLD